MPARRSRHEDDAPLTSCAMQGHTKAYVRTVDSDVVVLTINFFHELGLSELWVGFGTGKSYKDIPIHHISQLLGPQRCKVLPLFHAITGCEVVSAMFGIGKKTAWNAWISYPEVTDTLVAITQDPNSFTLDSLHMRHIEHWTVFMYSKNCNADGKWCKEVPILSQLKVSGLHPANQECLI